MKHSKTRTIDKTKLSAWLIITVIVIFEIKFVVHLFFK